MHTPTLRFCTSMSLVIFSALSPTILAAPAAATPEPIGLVIWTKGAVTATQPNAAPRKLERRSKIFAHDVIATDATSTGQIALTDTSVFSLDKATQFKIDDYKYKKDAGATDNKTVMSLVKGGFRTITGGIPKENPNGYQVNTPVATIGVRGTQYSTIISAKRGVLFKIDKGSIKVANGAGTIDLGKCATCTQFASVSSPTSVPSPLATMPAEFAAEPPIAPVSAKEIASGMQAGPANSASPGSTSTKPAGGSSDSGASSKNADGTSNSFCIK
jgi:hypothetical protein